MWHVSVAWQTRQGPVPLDKLSFDQRLRLYRLARATLNAVGAGNAFPFEEEFLKTTVQRRKLLSADEIRILPASKLPSRWSGHGELEE